MSYTISFGRLKSIHETHKRIVSRYIRLTRKSVPGVIHSLILLFYYESIPSSILTESESDTLSTILRARDQRLFHYDFPSGSYFEYKLIYSSSLHGIGEDIFKQKCHREEHLLCLIQTDNGNVFGGYTIRGWGMIHHTRQSDVDGEAFTFLIRSNRNYPPTLFDCVVPDMALYQQSGFYMMFGHADVCAFYIEGSGMRGGCSGNSPVYEPYPNPYYLTGSRDFGIVSVEVFQLRSYCAKQRL